MHETLDDRALARAVELHEKGLSRQALEVLSPFGPWRQFSGTRSLIIAARVLMNLGSMRLANGLATRAYRGERGHIGARCYFLSSRFDRGGPLLAWRTLQNIYAHPPQVDPAPDDLNHFHTVLARLAWSFRDFEAAELELHKAVKALPNNAWTWCQWACLFEMQDRYPEALEAAQRALEVRPWYRPGVQQVAHCLQLFDRDEEALALLEQAAQRLENLPVLMQLCHLQLDLELWSQARETLDKTGALVPAMEAVLSDWILRARARTAHGCGDWKTAAALAREVKDEPLWQSYAERADNDQSPRRRVRLPVEFVRQHHMTCAPATLSALSRFWKKPAEHLEVAEAICYDGTPAHSERDWAETHGWTAREFTVTLESAKALLDRGLPFTITTTEATSGHLQACIGYDELRETLLIRDPFHYYAAEFVCEPFLKRYAAHGPRGMVMVPAEQAQLLDGLDLPDAARHDQLYELNRALFRHDRAGAQAVLQQMQNDAPTHRLTLTARRALACYDGNSPALLEVLDAWLAQFPEDPNLQLARVTCLRQVGRREECLAFLKKLASLPFSEPVFYQALADELQADAREHSEARRWVEEALRYRLDGYSLVTLADLLWTGQDFAQSLTLYRYAACLDDKREPPARTYFQAARARKQTEIALALLRQRVARLGALSSAPACTLFECMEMVDLATEGFLVLEEALRQRPDDWELRLFLANARLRHGHIEAAEKLLAAVEGKARRASVIRATAECALLRGERPQALALWRELLELEPLAMDAHENVARLLGLIEGRAATLRHLEAARQRFPHHYGLHQLSISWLRSESPQAAEPVVRQLVAIHPADAWARRELASVLAEAGRLDDALPEATEAIRLDPQNQWGWALRAQIYARQGRQAEAAADFREALRLAVDTPSAIHGLVGLANTPAERKAALAFIESEFIRHIVFGGGLMAFREQCNLHLEPTETLASLRLALRERPDLAPAWSAVIHQLTDMQQLAEALSLAEQATERFSLVAEAWLDLARVRRAKLDLQGEIEALHHAAEVSPKWAEPCWLLGQAYERAGDFAAARRAFEQGLARQPFTAASHGLLAMRLWQDGDKEGGLARLKQALELDPEYQWAWDNFLELTKQMGRVELPHQFAQELTQRLPGQPRPWLMVANAHMESGKTDEALAALERALELHPRFTDAHELRALILASQRRWEEALAACRPAVFGDALPLTLRGRAAWIENARGHHRAALEQMRALLADNPGYHWGWQQLADWYFRIGDYEHAVEAATQMARLQPFNPMVLGYRADLKLRKEDRAGAKKDLARAVKLDPTYPYAITQLFLLQLEDNELEAALETLEILRKHHEQEKALSFELRLLARLLSGKKESPPALQAAYPDPSKTARQLLATLCLSPNVDEARLGGVIAALMEGEQYKLVNDVLEELAGDPKANPHVGALWAERRWDRGKRRCDRKMRDLLKQGETGRRAFIRFLELIADHKAEIRFRWSVNRQPWLHEHALGWAAVARGYNHFGRYRRVAEWCADWRQRSGLGMADLLPLHIALSNLGLAEEDAAVLQAAEQLPPDETAPIFTIHSALNLALAGATAEARDRLLAVNLEDLSTYYQLLKTLLDAVLKVQSATSTARSKAFDEALQDVRTVFFKYSLPRCDRALRMAYRQCFRRMGQDAGVRWRVWREYLRSYGVF